MVPRGCVDGHGVAGGSGNGALLFHTSAGTAAVVEERGGYSALDDDHVDDIDHDSRGGTGGELQSV